MTVSKSDKCPERAGSGVSPVCSRVSEISRISPEASEGLRLLLPAFLQQKRDPVKSPVGMLRSPGPGASFTQASSGLCNRSHVSAFVYSLGSQVAILCK